jgi:general secretion pathway protein D
VSCHQPSSHHHRNTLSQARNAELRALNESHTAVAKFLKGADATLTPSFTKRSLTTISRVQESVTAVVASVKQNNKGDSRVTIPVVGMVPILGRLFTTPKQTGSQSDIVITVTPHIIRPAEIKPEDHLARFSGTQSSGLSESIEDVVFRA